MILHQFLLVDQEFNSFLFKKILFSLNMMTNLNVKTMMNFAKSLGHATKVPMLIHKSYD